jgi:hypothetical protein
LSTVTLSEALGAAGDDPPLPLPAGAAVLPQAAMARVPAATASMRPAVARVTSLRAADG